MPLRFELIICDVVLRSGKVLTQFSVVVFGLALTGGIAYVSRLRAFSQTAILSR